MRGSGPVTGARAPLFERLVEHQPNESEEARPQRVLDREGLQRSLQRELERLLNTRTPRAADALAQEERTVLDYGLPDYSAMYTHSPEDQARLAALVRSTIEAFEPRLRGVAVGVEPLHDSEKSLLVRVSGEMILGRVSERVAFVVGVNSDTGGGGARGG